MAATTLTIKGEKTSKAFLSQFKARRTQTTLTEVIFDDKTVENSTCVLKETEKFYRTLYTSEATPPQEALDEWLSVIPSTPIQDSLAYPIDREELKEVIRTSPKNKAPGPDGLPYEFYRKHFEAIHPALLEVYNTALTNGTSIHEGGQGLTILIHKKGPKGELKNWRPITLLNTDQKILSKIMVNRLSTLTPHALHQYQHGFTPGRTIASNVHSVTNVLRDTTQQGVAVFLDQEKAYDRVSWKYLDACLKAHSFPATIRAWLTSLLQDSTIQVATGHGETDRIPLSRGLRQGDPLSPILYNMAIDPWIRHMSKDLRGITTYGQEALTVKAFADNCIVGLSSKQDARCFVSLLTRYSLLSQAKVNSSKSQAIVMGTPGFRPPLGIKPTNKAVRHLGTWVKVGGFDTHLMESNLLRDITQAMTSWRCNLVTQLGRAQVVNTLGYSKVWFTAQFFPLSTTFYQALNRLVQSALWRPNTQPVTTAKLFGGTSKGGLGLIDVKQVAARIFGRTMSLILSAHIPAPHWTVALKTQWTRALGLSPAHKQHTLNNWLSGVSSARGPQGMDPFWKRFLSTYKEYWSLRSFRPEAQHRGRAQLVWQPCFMGILAHPGTKVPEPPLCTITPEALEILPPWRYTPQNKFYWQACHMNMINLKMRTNTWKVLRRVYRTADRSNCTNPTCARCGEEDTLLHRFFLCPVSIKIWKTACSFLHPTREYTTPLHDVKWTGFCMVLHPRSQTPTRAQSFM